MQFIDVVTALCKLHNYCITQRESDSLEVDPNDVFNIAQEGGFTMNSSNERLDELLDGGLPDCNDPAYRAELRAMQRRRDLPIYKMLQYIEDNGYERPTPPSLT